jgi:hypothetical protein
MIRVLRSARQSAVKATSQAANQLKALLVTAPEDLMQDQDTFWAMDREAL